MIPALRRDLHPTAATAAATSLSPSPAASIHSHASLRPRPLGERCGERCFLGGHVSPLFRVSQGDASQSHSPSAYPPVRSRGGGAGGIGWRYGVIGVLGARGRKVPGAPLWVRAERQSPQRPATRYFLFWQCPSHRISTDVCAPRCARTAPQLEIGDTRPCLPPPLYVPGGLAGSRAGRSWQSAFPGSAFQGRRKIRC